MTDNRGDLIVEIKVSTGSSRPGVEEDGENRLKVRVNSSPEKGKANAEVISLLGRYYGVGKARVTIVRGASSRKKLVRVSRPENQGRD